MYTEEDTYAEATGMSILIFGNAFRVFGSATLGCLGAFSIGVGEEIRGCFED